MPNGAEYVKLEKRLVLLAGIRDLCADFADCADSEEAVRVSPLNSNLVRLICEICGF